MRLSLTTIFILIAAVSLLACPTSAQPYGWGHYLPNNESYAFGPEVAAFNSMTTYWAFDFFSVDVLVSPSNNGPSPAAGFDIYSWFDKPGASGRPRCRFRRPPWAPGRSRPSVRGRRRQPRLGRHLGQHGRSGTRPRARRSESG
jgi:hypothetical protein